MKQKEPEQKITTRYPLEVLEGIRRLAKEHNRSFNGEVIWALREYIKRNLKRQSDDKNL